MPLPKKSIFIGTNGNVWLNGQLLANIQKIEAKITYDLEDVTVIGDYATHHLFTGWNGEGTLSMYKIDSSVLKIVSDMAKTGVEPEITIISKLTNKNTKKTERIALKGVVLSEINLVNFEAQGTLMELVPFTFDDYDVFETA